MKITKATAKVAAVATGLAMATSMLSLAPIAHAQTVTTVNTTTSCSVGTFNLTIGSTGASVTCLQQGLIAAGFSIPAGATGYFGTQTRAAVASWQSSRNIAPAVGFFGPISRAAWNLGGGSSSSTTTTTSSVPGCVPGAMFSSTTGAACANVSTVPGCIAGALFSSTTGAACAPGTPSTPTTGGALQGTAGSITVTSTATDVEDKVLTGTTEMVLGFKVEASGSDVQVTHVRVKFTAAVDSSASDRLSDYASEIGIYADGKMVGSMAASEFTRDSSGVYSATIPASHIVRMNSANKVTFHVGFKAVSSIDSDNDGSTNDWTAALTLLRYNDATGVVLTDSTSVTNAGVYVDRASASSEVKLRMAEGLNNPKAQNVKVSTSGTTEVPLAEFTLKAEGAAMYFSQLRASTTITGTSNVSDIASDFYLMRGSAKIAEVAATTGTSQALTFSLDTTEELASGATATYKIVAKVKAIASTDTSTTFGGSDTITASTSVSVWNINAKADSDGKSVTERAGSVTTYIQTLYNEGVAITKVAMSATEEFTLLANDTAANVEGQFKVKLRVTNFGSNDLYIPLNSLATTSASAGSTKGIAFGLTDGTTATSTGQTGTITGSVAKTGTGGIVKTNSVLIAGGQSADFILTTTFNPDAVYTGTRQYRVQIWSVGHATTDTATAATIVSTTPTEDFRTGDYSIQN